MRDLVCPFVFVNGNLDFQILAYFNAAKKCASNAYSCINIVPMCHNKENNFRSKLSYLDKQSGGDRITSFEVRAKTCVWLNFCIEEQQCLLIKR